GRSRDSARDKHSPPQRLGEVVPWLTTIPDQRSKFNKRFLTPFLVPTPTPVDLTGTWALRGADVAGKVALARVVINQVKNGNNFNVSGYFDWQETDYLRYGRESFSGTFDPATNTISLVGETLTNAQGIALGMYQANVSANGSMLTDGSW